jgi:hypothetical protein
MAGSGPGDLDALAHELLDAAVEALDTIPILAPGLGGSPERSFVSPGLPALDCCDQLTVHVAAVNEHPSGQSNTHKSGARKNLVTLVIHATRCHDIETVPPLPETLEATAEQMNADGWALWNHFWKLMRSGDLLTLCDEVIWDGLRALTPSGGCGGWTLTIRGAYQGYEEP